MLFYLPVLGNLIFSDVDGLGLGKYLFWGGSDWSSLFGSYDWETNVLYIIRPIWLLLSFLSLGLYGFILSKSGLSALPRTSIFMSITAVSQLLIFFCLLIFGYFVEFERYYWVESIESLFKGYIRSNFFWFGETGDAKINPLSYLYIPNLIATVALAYYTRIKNAEENPEYPGTEEAPEEQSFGISAYGASKLKEAKELLDNRVISEEEFQQIKDEYLQ